VKKPLRQTNFVQTKLQDLDTGGIYEYVGTGRDCSDASSDEQEELGWESGTIVDGNAVGVDRSPRVSQEAQQKVQFNPPNFPQRVEKLPKRINLINPRSQGPAIRNGKNLNSYQHGNLRFSTPVDVDQHKFEGKSDNQLLPMDIDQRVTEELGNSDPKVTTDQLRANVSKPSNPRSAMDQINAKIIQELMGRGITIPLGPLLDISPNMRSNLADAVKPSHEAFRQAPEKREKGNQVIQTTFSAQYEKPLMDEEEPQRWED
jgi:hypothetical protein